MEQQEERDLIVSLKNLRAKKKELLQLLEEVKFDEAKVESALIEELENKSATATARYDNVGVASISKPRLFASCNIDNFPKLEKYLAEIGRTDLIKTTVMPSTLSAFVSELISEGKPIPDYVNYYLKATVRITE